MPKFLGTAGWYAWWITVVLSAFGLFVGAGYLLGKLWIWAVGPKAYAEFLSHLYLLWW